MYTAQDVYDVFFTGDRCDDKEIAISMYKIDGYELAQLFYENLGELCTKEQFEQIEALQDDFQQILQRHFGFYEYQEYDTGYLILEAV